MNNLVKRISAFVLMLVCVLTLAGCNKVKESNYEKIKEDMSKAKVVEILGTENASTTLDDFVICYWFDGAKTYNDALEKLADGKTVKTIKVTFLDNKVQTVYFGDFKVE